MEKLKQSQRTIFFDDDLWDWLGRYASDQNRTRTGQLNTILRQQMNHVAQAPSDAFIAAMTKEQLERLMHEYHQASFYYDDLSQRADAIYTKLHKQWEKLNA